MNKLRVFESFAGVGSQAMALRNIGVDYEVVGISEVDRYGLLAYSSIHDNALSEEIEYPSKKDMLMEIEDKHIGYNFSTDKSEVPKGINDLKKLYKAHILSKNYGDIRLINEKEIPDFDLFTYSYPCKNISTAGNQKGLEKNSGTQSSLVWECERIIKEKRPKYLLMENVSNLVSKRHIGDFKDWINVLEELGYDNYWKVLNGLNYIVPQKRERVIMISIRKDLGVSNYEMPEGKLTDKRFIDILEENVDNEYIVSNENYSEYIRTIVNNNKNTEKLNNVNRIGGLYDTSERKRQAGAIWDKYGFAPTIDTMQGGYRQPLVIDGENIRKITPKEAWRLQGFLDSDFEKAKEMGLSNSKLYERAGRGIVVPMLEEVFKALLGDEYAKKNNQ